MKKLMVLFLILIPVLLFPSGKRWYVSTVSAGTASGDSWTNKKSLSTFNWALVLPGDSVFLDGGIDSLVYNQCASISPGTLSGTIDSKITITKGKEPNHNGKVIIGGNVSSQYGAALFAYNINFTEWSFLTFRGASDNTFSSTIVTVGITDSRGVILSNCEIRNDASDGIVLVNCQDIKVINNNIINNKNCSWATDGLHIQGGKNLEIAYNRIQSNNQQNVSLIKGHRDLIHFNAFQTQGGITKIHDNQFMDISNSDSALGLIYGSTLAGQFQIYNNLFLSTSTKHAGIINLNAFNYVASYKVFNNTIFASKTSINPFEFYNSDTLIFKNNILHAPNNWIAWMFDYKTETSAYIEIDYNQYFISKGDSSRFAYFYEINNGTPPVKSISWSTWKSKGWDNHSEFVISNFVNAGGFNAKDYKLKYGSSGIDKGFPINLFNVDLEGIKRPQGDTWDRGAFENSTNSESDLIPPKLNGAALINPTTVELIFSEQLELNTSLNKLNYSIPEITINSVSPSADGRKIILSTTQHKNGIYNVNVSNLKDLVGNLISNTGNSAIYSCAWDMTPPELILVELLDSVNVDITFSEPMDSLTANNTSNYSLTNEVVIKSARLTNQNKVRIVTSNHIPNTNCLLTVQNLKDFSGNLINSLSNSKQYSFIKDIISPDINSLSYTNIKSLTLNFSEKVDPLRARNKSNYKISDGVIINSVQILPDSSSVLLKTTNQSRNVNYILTVANISDRTGNILSPNPRTISHSIPAKSKGNTTQYSILDASGSWTQDYVPSKSIDGTGMNNPDSRWLSSKILPDTIKYDTGSSNLIDSIKISFYGWETGNVYKYSIISSDDLKEWSSIVKDVWSENTEWTELGFSAMKARYIKIILTESNQCTSASIWETAIFGTNETANNNRNENFPLTYSLSQNYPNPFNPSTKIRVELPTNTSIVLTVYNILGEMVQEIMNAEVPAGTHEFTFDGTGLASGIYIYRIETPEFSEVKKMMLLR